MVPTQITYEKLLNSTKHTIMKVNQIFRSQLLICPEVDALTDLKASQRQSFIFKKPFTFWYFCRMLKSEKN